MSLKRSHTSGKSSFGGGSDGGAKVDRQELFDELKRLAGTNDAFTPVDVALAIGAGEPAVSKALLGWRRRDTWTRPTWAATGATPWST